MFYDPNDSGLYYKTVIVINLALAMIINCDPSVVFNDHKVRYKLKHTFTIVFCQITIKNFILQATDWCALNFTITKLIALGRR